jgi:ATP-binding cassette subfamily F protein 3
MLDEPTNHLDMHSVELLVEALNKYEGSLIFVSHDRYFVSKAANKIWEIQDQQVKEFKGTYDEYVEWKERMAKREKELAKSTPLPVKETPVVAPTPKAPAVHTSQEDKNQVKKELQKKQRQFAQLEEKIAQVQQEKTTLESQLGAPDVYANKDRYTKTESAYQQITTQLSSLQTEFEKLFEELMQLEAKL